MSRATVFLASLLLTLNLSAGTDPEADLRASVSAYWDALRKRDLYEALQYVESDSRSRFIERKWDRIRNWELERIEFFGEWQAQVFLSVERYIHVNLDLHRVSHSEVWVFEEGRWRVRIPHITSAGINRILTGTNRVRRPRDLPETIQIVPRRIEMSFLNPVQMGSVLIRNGLGTAVRVAGVEFDADRFELTRQVETVEPGQEGRLTLRYLGDEEEKDLTSTLRFQLHYGEEAVPVEIPVVYNHVNRTTRNFFGLSDEDVRNLKRGDPLRPGIQLDPSGIPPPVKLPDDADQEDAANEEPPN